MSTAEEILAAAMTNAAHGHSVTDTDPHFVIDPTTREIKGEAYREYVLQQYDHNSERVTFEISRYVDGHDMALCNQVEIHFVNMDAESGEHNVDVYHVTDLQATGDVVTCSWLVSSNATQLVGPLAFAVRYACLNGSEVVYDWHTATNTDYTVGKSMNNAEAAVARCSDIIQEFIDSTNAQIEGNIQHLADSVAQAQASQDAAAASEAAALAAQTAAENSATQVAAIVAGNEAYTKHETDYRSAPPIVESAEGETIQVTDSAERPLQGLRLFGKTTQQTTTGKNLLPVEETLIFEGYKIYPVNIPAGTYILSLEEMQREGTYQPYIHFVSNNIGSYLFTSTKEVKITLTQDEAEIRIYSNNFSADGSAGISATVKRLMLSLNGGDWEPYSGGMASPCPDWPQELTSLENVTATLHGKNLINIAEMINEQLVQNGDGTYTLTKNGTGSLRFSAKQSCDLPKGTYTITVGSAAGTEETIRVALTCENGKEIAAAVYVGTPKTIQADSEITKIAVYIPADRDDGAYTTFTGLQMETGAVQTAYGEYKAPQAITLQHTLPGIPVESGGNYTDADGQQWICDEIDLQRGVYVQRIHTATLTDFSKYTASVYTPTGGVTEGCIHLRLELVQGYALCDKFIYQQSGTDVRFAILANGGAYFTIAGEYTTDEWVAKMSEISPTIAVALASPIETALSAEELAAYAALLTNKPTTTVLNDAGAHMVLDYVADTKLYIDNKFAALAAELNNV